MTLELTITDLLEAWRAGSHDALEDLMTRVEQRLRVIARFKLRDEFSNHFQTTELLNESVLTLLEKDNLSIQNREHFYGLMGTIMNRILIDSSRKRHAVKHGGKAVHEEENEDTADAPQLTEELLAIHEAIEKMAKVSPEMAVIVRLKYFWGLTSEEIERVIDLSLPTVTRRLAAAKSFLAEQLRN